jgi:UDP-N-acetylmuramoyl-L-alanyl-D-glutamate--2,6-diaminopimelate ligase
MEVSSHGLEQKRVDGVDFVSAHFTNLTQDHLDYHHTMEAYGVAKQKLFRFASLKRAIINADDPYAEKICLATKRDIPVVMYTLAQKSASMLMNRSSLEYVFAKEVELTHKGIKATLHTPWGQGQLRSNLIGEFNLYNLLGVLAELCLQGVSLEEALHTLYYLLPAPGRMQRFGTANTPLVIVDYAHTPDALENALQAAKLQCSRRLWCVFGCGGERDKDKRAKMGNVAQHYADRIVLTNDNPRHEEPLKIVDDILQGIQVEHTDKVMIELERGKAIQFAIENALALDTILIAGKGHESTQQIGDKFFPFNDAEFVKNLLNKDSQHETISYS